MTPANFDVVAMANARILPLGHRCVLAVIKPYDDAPGGRIATIGLADLVTDYAASNRADNGSCLSAIALAHRIAENTAGYRADDCTERAAIAAPLDINLLHFLDHSAGAALHTLVRVSTGGRVTTVVVAALGRRNATGERKTGRKRTGQREFRGE